MGVPIKNLVPYRITIQAVDSGSGKAISNSLYYRNGVQSVAPPAYGAAIAGPSNTSTVLTNFKTMWDGIRALLNANYKTLSFVIEAIVGKRFPSPQEPIASLVYGPSAVELHTVAPHGLITGSTVNLYGVSSPTSVNGIWTVNLLTPTSVTLNGSGVPTTPWSGDGYWQRAIGQREFLFTDKTTLVDESSGGIVGQALPLFATASIRRLNTGTGRNFRSRMSLGPMSEVDSQDGGWTAGTKVAWAAVLSTFYTTALDNGGTDIGSGFMYDLAVSQKLAMGLPTPFTQSSTWTSLLTGYAMQPNCGSLVRRKPRLTSVIV